VAETLGFTLEQTLNILARLCPFTPHNTAHL
jgi:hypothetical protein